MLMIASSVTSLDAGGDVGVVLVALDGGRRCAVVARLVRAVKNSDFGLRGSPNSVLELAAERAAPSSDGS